MISKKILADTIRILTIDAIQKSNSGHPGAPMGMADIAEVLWRDYMNHNPNNPKWINRDRFVLSNGHASMLLYSILYLTGYNISIKDIKKFRQFNSKTPGHPEFNKKLGIEITTGPLGQGFANAVGFAIAEKTLSAQFNKPNYEIINHKTYVFLGDGCMMEGISHEAASLAGTLKLGKLIAFYDDNGISIDGNVKEWFNDNTKMRFESYGWHVISNVDGHDSLSISKAIKNSIKISNKPSLIICKTIIAFGSPNKSNTHESHGSPLGKEEIKLIRKNLNWNYSKFIIPNNILHAWNASKCGQNKENLWKIKYKEYKKIYPKLSKEFKRRIIGDLPNNWEIKTNKFIKKLQKEFLNISTRHASQKSLNFFSKIFPELIGGSADLTPSNLTFSSTSKSIAKFPEGNYIHYGVREFAMTAIANGISAYNGFIPYTSTFLVFMEYARNAVRMSSLMKLKHIMIYTHDSIGLGEDGPTHQPIEQISSLRIIPNIVTWRPCDQVETAIAWKEAIKSNNPTALIFSRQITSHQKRSNNTLLNIYKGGYILKDCKNIPDIIFISTGSEVELAVKAYKILKNEGYNVRVVSFPSTQIFDMQDIKYKNLVLPPNIKKRISIEAGSSDFWYKYVGLDGYVIGIDRFGKSAPFQEIYEEFGLNLKNILYKSYKLLNK
ncbi:transketolase [Sodalis-like secondary symbiont of Drepanosiphum platanoidis]|uniref:transketolase n=1 Tax=Sodalis-like secondary symbiont of Drepanosiphum platanoidis TaxID=2994493 RepID=UPI00346480D1